MAAVNSPPCGRGQLGQLAADYLVEAGPDVYRCNVVKLHYMGSPHDKLHFLLIARCSNVIAGRVNCARACVRAFVSSCVRAFVRSCVRAFVRSCSMHYIRNLEPYPFTIGSFTLYANNSTFKVTSSF